MKQFRTLALGELRNVLRDSLMLLMLLAPLMIALAFRFIFPFARGLLLPGFDLAEHYGFIMSMLLVLTPMMCGALTGFLFLEERDEQILTYMSVTPLGKGGYLAYKLTFPVLLSIVYSLPLLWLAGLAPFSVWKVLPIALMAALEAPLMALFLAAFAENKVEGTAIYKLAGLVDVAPFVGYLVHSPLRYLAGVIPQFWITVTWLEAHKPGGAYWQHLAAGFAVHIIVIWIFLRIFNRRAG